MNIRNVLQLGVFLSSLAGGLCFAEKNEEVMKEPYEPTWESLEQYGQAPDWFRDAKFGIWAHWGPQSQPEQGDWYARHMYMEDFWQYKWHVQNYGHPSRFGFRT